jgi:hypothetical protein
VFILALIGFIFSAIFLAMLGVAYVNQYRRLLQKHEGVVGRRVKDQTGSNFEVLEEETPNAFKMEEIEKDK